MYWHDGWGLALDDGRHDRLGLRAGDRRVCRGEARRSGEPQARLVSAVAVGVERRTRTGRVWASLLAAC
jgi:hypothetical protein